jgi:hypothetical protein
MFILCWVVPLSFVIIEPELELAFICVLLEFFRYVVGFMLRRFGLTFLLSYGN